jgi:hypothetical protein
MGCGASKNTVAIDAPIEPEQPVVESAREVTVKPCLAPVATAKPSLDEAIDTSATKNEATEPDLPRIDDDAELMSITKSINKPSIDSGLESNEDLSKDDTAQQPANKRSSLRFRSLVASASSSNKADDEAEADPVEPVIAERPSSRGGLAFDMTFEGEQSRARVPARLDKLRSRTRSSEMSVDELKLKLAAADARRQEYESRLKDKMKQESNKAERIQQAHASADVSTLAKTEQSQKENKAIENREANLKAIRERLQAREERAKRVREAKRASGSSRDFANAAPVPLTTVN